MGMQSSGAVEIAKPVDVVFRWLVEPEKLTAWTGGAGLYPADPSVLGEGFEATGPVPAMEGEATLRIRDWNPPLGYTAVMTYSGGDSTTTYELREAEGVTTLAVRSDTDWGRPDLSALEAQMAGQSPEIQAAMRQALDMMAGQVGAGAYDATAQAGMQASLDESLAKLKALVEAG